MGHVQFVSFANDALYGTLTFLYTQLCIWRVPLLYQRIVYIFLEMNKKHPILFLTWFNKFSQVSYPGSSQLLKNTFSFTYIIGFESFNSSVYG